jgi:hypothetical protein
LTSNEIIFDNNSQYSPTFITQDFRAHCVLFAIKFGCDLNIIIRIECILLKFHWVMKALIELHFQHEVLPRFIENVFRSTLSYPNETSKECIQFLSKDSFDISIEYISPWAGFKLTIVVVIGTDYIDSCKSNNHTIATYPVNPMVSSDFS